MLNHLAAISIHPSDISNKNTLFFASPDLFQFFFTRVPLSVGSSSFCWPRLSPLYLRLNTLSFGFKSDVSAFQTCHVSCQHISPRESSTMHSHSNPNTGNTATSASGFVSGSSSGPSSGNFSSSNNRSIPTKKIQRHPFSFGVIADVQYADKPEKESIKNGMLRVLGYRSTLYRLEDALREFERSFIDFVIHVGDIVDGNDSQHANETDLNTVLQCFQRHQNKSIPILENHTMPLPVFHVLGNHCRCLPNDYLIQNLAISPSSIDEKQKIIAKSIPKYTNNGGRFSSLASPSSLGLSQSYYHGSSPKRPSQTAYYSFEPAPGWAFIVLDGSELCPKATDAPENAVQIMRDLCDLNNFEYADHRSAISETQLKWFSDTLEYYADRDLAVFVFCHYPIYEKATRPTHILVNAQQVLDILDRFPGVIRVWFSGHDHLGGYAERNHVHHITVAGMVEGSPAKNPYAIVRVMPSETILINGRGNVQSRCLNPPS